MKSTSTLRMVLASALLTAVASPLAAQSGVAVVNAASFQAGFPVSPGAWATAFGDFASVGVSNTIADSVPFPTVLGGVRVLVDGVAAPMNFAGGSQINFLVPPGTAEGRVPFRVEVSGMTTFDGTTQIWPISPGLISINPGAADKPGAILNQDNSLNTAQNPARPGEIIQVFGVGADFSELPEAGAQAPTDRLIPTATPTRAYVFGFVEAPVQFSGLAPGLVNAWQLNLIVPDDAVVDGQVPIQAEVSGLKTNSVSFWVAR